MSQSAAEKYADTLRMYRNYIGGALPITQEQGVLELLEEDYIDTIDAYSWLTEKGHRWVMEDMKVSANADTETDE